MVNDRYMGSEQIPVTVGGKTYYGCCAGCKDKLQTQASARTALDPVTGKPVDEATAVIARTEAGKVMYFESAETLRRFSAVIERERPRQLSQKTRGAHHEGRNRNPADTSRWPEQVFGLSGAAADRARFHAEERLRTTYARITAASLGGTIRIPVLLVHDRKDPAVPFEDALTNVRSIRDAGVLATTGHGHTSILRAPEVIEEVVRFTASDVERRASTPQRRLDREIFVPDVRWAEQVLEANWAE